MDKLRGVIWHGTASLTKVIQLMATLHKSSTRGHWNAFLVGLPWKESKENWTPTLIRIDGEFFDTDIDDILGKERKVVLFTKMDISHYISTTGISVCNDVCECPTYQWECACGESDCLKKGASLHDMRKGKANSIVAAKLAALKREKKLGDRHATDGLVDDTAVLGV